MTGLVAVTAAMFALGTYLGRDIAYQWEWILFAGSLVLLVGVIVTTARSQQTAIALLLAFGVVTGLSVAPTIA
jgi:hypothetical protein